MAVDCRTNRGRETSFFYKNTKVAARKFSKKPGFFGIDA